MPVAIYLHNKPEPDFVFTGQRYDQWYETFVRNLLPSRAARCMIPAHDLADEIEAHWNGPQAGEEGILVRRLRLMEEASMVTAEAR